MFLNLLHIIKNSFNASWVLTSRSFSKLSIKITICLVFPISLKISVREFLILSIAFSTESFANVSALNAEGK